ncbi:MAG: hypothetical protein JSR59_04005 [Proteobacteria bacterium]|nr:hypothetical protein [Pseudomonadota bacterium]
MPADLRHRHHIAHGDTVVVADDVEGIRIITQERALAEVQAYCAALAPVNVLLSQELLADRRSELERD